ncbi:MAG: DUF503 domain-containing protein [Clostridia bacterium]
MVTLSLCVTFHIPFAHSLKEKRRVVKSLVDKVRHRFNVSIAEVSHMDVHQMAVIGLAVVSNDPTHARSQLDIILGFMESNTDANVIHVEQMQS